jgi:hypothetical protein
MVPSAPAFLAVCLFEALWRFNSISSFDLMTDVSFGVKQQQAAQLELPSQNSLSVVLSVLHVRPQIVACTTCLSSKSE